MKTSGRYAFADCDGEGLLLDLRTGSLYQLNKSAAAVWKEALSDVPPAKIAELLSQRYGLSGVTAQQHVTAALALEPGHDEASLSSDPYLYERSADTYTLSRDGIPLLTIDAAGGWLRLSSPGAVPAAELPMVLQAVSPKLMSLRGHFVLHGSAVVLGQAVVAFCGKSGAGKTTTARAFAAAGAILVCEDKLVVRRDAGLFMAVLGGERSIMSWVAEESVRLAAGETITCNGLDRALSGDSLPIEAIGFLDSTRRAGSTITGSLLSAADAARSRFGNAFFGSDAAVDWTRQLQSAADATRRLRAYAVTAPAGVVQLRAAAQDFANAGRWLIP
jgi:hypothetical protein